MFLTKRRVPSGALYWYIVDRNKGKARWKATGIVILNEDSDSPEYQRSLQLAERKVGVFEKEKEEIRQNGGIENIRLSQFEKTYFRNYTKSKGTRNADRYAFNELHGCFGDPMLQDIADCERLRKSMAKHLGSVSINMRFRSLRSIFNFALGKYIRTNPFSHNIPPKSRKRINILTKDQMLQLVNYVEENETKMIQCLFKFILYTGVRLGEALNLKWHDIKDDVINLYRPKVDNFGALPIFPQLREVLDSLPRESEYLFSKEGKSLRSDYITKRFKKILRRNGIPDIKAVHGLRHNFASWFLIRGGEISKLQVWLGHTDIRTTQMYSHLKMVDIQEAAAHALPI